MWSICSCHCVPWYQTSLLHLQFAAVTALVLVVSLFGLPKLSFPLILTSWCLSRLICTACGSPATCFIWCVVALELSNFLVSCCTLLAGNFSRSMLPSLKQTLHPSGKNKKNVPVKDLCSFRRVLG